MVNFEICQANMTCMHWVYYIYAMQYCSYYIVLIVNFIARIMYSMQGLIQECVYDFLVTLTGCGCCFTPRCSCQVCAMKLLFVFSGGSLQTAQTWAKAGVVLL